MVWWQHIYRMFCISGITVIGVFTANRKELSTQPCGTPLFKFRMEEVWLPVRSLNYLFVRWSSMTEWGADEKTSSVGLLALEANRWKPRQAWILYLMCWRTSFSKHFNRLKERATWKMVGKCRLLDFRNYYGSQSINHNIIQLIYVFIARQWILSSNIQQVSLVLGFL